MFSVIDRISSTNFNTSHVNVNPYPYVLVSEKYPNFNTSHVNVNRLTDKGIQRQVIRFQYISC